MREDNIKIIRAACVAANPSILDLVFGCEVAHASGKMTIVSDYYSDLDTKLFTLRGEAGNIFRESQKAAKQHYEILGRPIRLADVLVAIKEKSQTIEGLADDKFIVFDTGIQRLVYQGLWNLRADRLEDQSEETLAFVAGLLK